MPTATRVGPLRMLDLIGLDVAVGILRRLGHAPTRHLMNLADAGWTGVGAGHGFYRYTA